MRYDSLVRPHRFRTIVLIIGLIIFAVTALAVLTDKTSEITSIEGPNIITGRPKPVTLDSRIVVFGNVNWGGLMDSYAQDTSDSIKYPFSGLASFSRQNYDGWLATLRCPITDESPSAGNQEASGRYACKSSYLLEANFWFSGFSLASDHLEDYGETAARFTPEILTANNIQYFGNQQSPNSACNILVISARYRMRDGSSKQARLPLGVCGFSLNRINENDYEAVEQISALLPTWVTVDASSEHQDFNKIKTDTTYRQFIDSGADLVVGSSELFHPVAEEYKDRLIVYALGTFLKASPAISLNSDANHSMGLVIAVESLVDQEILDWVDFAEPCRFDFYNCLEIIADKDLKRVNYAYSFALLPADHSNRGVAIRASEEWYQRVLEEMGWDQLLEKLKTD